MTPPRRLSFVAVAALFLVVTPFGQQREANSQASYNGGTIDVSRDWEGAQACAVFSAKRVDCFDTFEAMEAATGGADSRPEDHDIAANTVVAWSGGAVEERGAGGEVDAQRVELAAGPALELAADCDNNNSKWLYLYEHTNFGGRVLKFNDVNYWQNLTDYGFNDQTSSYWNTTVCNAYFAEHTGGGGSWLLIVANTSASSMPLGWNDRVSSLYIIG